MSRIKLVSQTRMDVTEYSIGDELPGGTAPVVLTRLSDGQQFVLKSALGGVSAHSLLHQNAHEANEYLAFQLYRAAGCRVPDGIDFVQVEGKNIFGLLENFINGVTLHNLMHVRDPSIVEFTFPTIRSDLVIHGLFANWDINMMDNIMVSYTEEGGKRIFDYTNPITVDCGGTLQFRAMGDLKRAFSPEVSNIKSIVQYSQSYKPMGVLMRLSPEDLNKEICKRWNTVNKDAILAAFDTAVPIVAPHFKAARAALPGLLDVGALRDMIIRRMAYLDSLCSAAAPALAPAGGAGLGVGVGLGAAATPTAAAMPNTRANTNRKPRSRRQTRRRRNRR